MIAGCISTVAPPPTAGHGTPYKGKGQPIVASDTPTGWDVKEGGTVITSEQALEASGDPEYETRRQIAKHYNDRLYDQGRAHSRNGTIMVVIGVATVVAGVVLSSVLANSLRSESTVAATVDMPETRTYGTGTLKAEGAGLVIGGAVVAGLGYAPQFDLQGMASLSVTSRSIRPTVRATSTARRTRWPSSPAACRSRRRASPRPTSRAMATTAARRSPATRRGRFPRVRPARRSR